MSRLTHWNYKNTTLPLDSSKPYWKLGEIEDLEEKYNVSVNEELFKKAKAFDILKVKRIDRIGLRAYKNVADYNTNIKRLNGYYDELTEEEFNLLKEE